MTEKDFYRRLNRQLSDSVRLTRIETDLALGVCDVWASTVNNFGWVELKVGEFNQRTHRISIKHPLTAAQCDFITDCMVAGCSAVVLIGVTVGPGWWRYVFIYDPAVMEWLVGKRSATLSELLTSRTGAPGRALVPEGSPATIAALWCPP